MQSTDEPSRPLFRFGFAGPRRHRRGAVRRRRAALEVSLLEARCLLATANGPYTFPRPSVDGVGKVLYDGVTGTFQKSITITNNSPDQWLYAFLEGEVTRQAIAPYEGTGAFDPYDSVNQEYRGYIGYTDGSQDYAGLPPKSSITITVPLAFWDSGRIVFSTDGANQFSTYGGPDGGSPPGAPFNYLDSNTQATFFGSIEQGQLNQLNFTPIYTGFDAANGGMPTTSGWKSPITSGLFTDGQTLVVTGPGLPANGLQVTVDASHPNSLTLPVNADSAESVQQYTFSALPGEILSPTARYIQDKFQLVTQGTTTADGLVMWYHALTSAAPNNDAAFQLTEVSFRGDFYDPAVNVGTGFQYLLGPDVFPGAKTNSVDYDISFVDTINLPVAMEASDVAIPNTSQSAPFGWVGSGQSLDAFQAAIQAFTTTNPAGQNQNYLGTYFNGRGYPSYVPIDPNSTKLPSGQNLFLASPAIGAPADIHFYKKFNDNSVIQEPLYALTSGGTGPSTLSIGGASSYPAQPRSLELSTITMANRYMLEQLIAPNLAAGQSYRVTYQGNTFAGNVVGMYYAPDGQTIIGVKLDRDLPPNAASQVYNFTLAQTDYAASRIAGLWYSWAKYYVDHVPSSPQNNLAGTISNDNILTLAAPNPGLVPGMAVTGAGVPAGCIILSVSSDQSTLQLSAKVSGNPTSFSFAAPSFSTIVGYDSSPTGETPPIALSFSAAEQPYAMAFARTIFVVMSAWSVSVPSGTQNAWNPLLVNMIGGNLGSNYLPDANSSVVNTLTVLSKSALRGVPDFTNPLYSDEAQWYPDPALPAGGQSYNVYNLDPFVWFVHKKLGLTAYAFALDDDIGNVNAGGATHLDISVGGLDGLQNRDPYTNLSPWGVVSSQVASTQEKSSILAGLNTPQVVYQIAQFDYPHDTPGTLVNGPGVAMGTTVQFTQISNDLSQSQIIVSSPLSSPSSNAWYAFFGPMSFRGTVLGAGQADDTIVLDGTDAYNTLVKLGPLQNLRVTGEGIDPSQTVWIKGLTQGPAGVVTLQLSANLDRSQVSQPGSFYAYTIGSPVVGLIRDEGFEWAGVSDLSGQFNHGVQLTENTVDWTFNDSTTNPNHWFAGIAFNNSSSYTQGNQAARQGLQVAFIQGDSRISQTVTVGSGVYLLDGQAAQSALFPSPQILSVLVDGQPVGTITPQGVNYQPFEFRITLTGGTHTIAFVGTQSSSGTALLDALALTPALSLPGPALVLDVIPDQVVREGQRLTFTATASGATELTYSLGPNAPAGASIEAQTGVFTWRPSTPGVFTLTILVRDQNHPSLSASRTVSIRIDNVAPIVSLIPTFTPGQTPVFRGLVSYVDVSTGPHVATVDYGDGSGVQPLRLEPDGTFRPVHAYSQPGTYHVVVSVWDAFGGVGTAQLTLAATSDPLVSGYGRGVDAFVIRLYQDLLGRLPEPAALTFWAGRLRAGVNPSIVAYSIWNSPEHQARLRGGQAVPISPGRAYINAIVVMQRTVRLQLPPPRGPLTLRVTGVPSTNRLTTFARSLRTQ